MEFRNMSSSQQHISRFVIATILIGISFTAQSALIRVSQESAVGVGDFDTNVLGFIDSFVTTSSIVDFYGYGVGNVPSYQGGAPNEGPAAMSSTTQSFFVEASDGLHYVVVHDARLDGGIAGRARMGTTLTGGAGGTAGYSVQDDVSPDDSYLTSDSAGNRFFDTIHFWSPCCTDGFAVGDLSSSFLLYADFLAPPVDITGWQATGNSRPDIALDIGPRHTVRFDIASPVPVPAAVWLFGTALLGLVGFGKRKSRIAA